MIFTPPAFVPQLPFPLPLQETIGDFCMTARFAKVEASDSVEKQPGTFIEAAIDRHWTTSEIDARVGRLAAALAAVWEVAPGQKWHNTVAILASNSMDILILSWAIHRVGGACLMLQPTSSAEEMAAHLDRIPQFAMFASEDLLSLGRDALRLSKVSPELPFYRFSEPPAVEPVEATAKIPTLNGLIEYGKELPPLQKSSISNGEANRRVAYYCTTSGTSGFQASIRIVAITHANIIASVLQAGLFLDASKGKTDEITLAFLPFNHIYGLLITHTFMWRGDCTVIHRGFDMMAVLTSIGKYNITTLYLVPPIINALSRNAKLLDRFNLSSVRYIVSGGGPLNKEAYLKMQAARPDWQILPGWGQTESSGIGSLSAPSDPFPGSSGVLLPGVRIRLRNDEGKVLEGLEEMGEIEISSPSVLRGYISDANEPLLPETDEEELWWPTGDVGLFRLSPTGEQHLFVVDRIRDMIKVKGNQVAPGQIECHLLQHAAIAEAAVIAVADEIAGERALAFIVREPSYTDQKREAELRKVIQEFNDLALPEVCRLQDRIVFVDQIPKSASGKILKRELRKLVASKNPSEK